MPSTTRYGTSTAAFASRPASGVSTPTTTSRHIAAIHVPTAPDSSTTRRCSAICPATIAARPSIAARLNTFEPITTPAPTLACPWPSAATAAVISGASAASAASTPSRASDIPARSPSRSSRVTSTQLAARLTATPAANSADQAATGMAGAIPAADPRPEHPLALPLPRFHCVRPARSRMPGA